MTRHGETSPLREALAAAAAEIDCPLKALTAMASQNDPFRIDTPARHRDGKWLAVTARELGLAARRIHLRGLHYMVLGRPKPGGVPYANTDKDWAWLQGDAGKAARWLGYIPFEQITDQRNAEPQVREFSQPQPWPYVTVGIDVELPRAADIMPELGVQDFDGAQPYHLVMVGEKSSLADVLGSVAETYQADLYLPTGEPSDSMLHRMATAAVNDGRPMVVLYFSDADPAGWTMPLSVSRKLQALKVLLPCLPDFEVHRVALTPEQVREYGLPSTPLKETEKRADMWRAAMGVEQTEIDALASLRPELLRQIARDALDPFYDWTLGQRVVEARGRWIDEALGVINRALDGSHLARIRAQAETKLTAMRRQIAELNDQLRIDVDDFDLPPIHVPEAQVSGSDGLPLLDSRWPFTEQCLRLVDSKAYRAAEGCAA